MTRDQALAVLRELSLDLAANESGRARLLERVSQAGEPEMMRALLVELGAAALLAERRRDVTPTFGATPVTDEAQP